MAKKKAAKKKSAGRKKKSASTSKMVDVPTTLPMPLMNNSKKGEDLLCKISLLFALLFVLSLFQGIGQWAISVSWWIWLLLSILFGLKPLIKFSKK